MYSLRGDALSAKSVLGGRVALTQRGDKNRTMMSQMKIKIAHIPSNVGEEWMKMIWGKSSR